MRIPAITLAMALGLGACSDLQDQNAGTVDAGTETSEAVESNHAAGPETASSPQEFSMADLGIVDVDYIFWLSDNETRAQLRVPDEFALEFDDENGPARIVLSGYREDARSHGRTQGVSFQVPDEVERSASGRLIEVIIIARSPQPATFRAAYSTREVGNSGWRELEVEDSWTAVSLTYTVRPMEEGAGDYIGVLPPTENVVEIAGIAVRILGE